nr:DUF4870 domain-containing protein [Janibacter alkaliphilus]
MDASFTTGRGTRHDRPAASPSPRRDARFRRADDSGAAAPDERPAAGNAAARRPARRPRGRVRRPAARASAAVQRRGPERPAARASATRHRRRAGRAAARLPADRRRLPAADPAAASVTPEEERNLGMIAHLAPAILLPLSAGTAGFVVSLVIFLVYKDRGPFVRAHAANSLNVQIITGIVLLLSVPLMFVLIGFITYPAALVFAVVVHVIGAMKANQGQWWNPPLTPTFVR